MTSVSSDRFSVLNDVVEKLSEYTLKWFHNLQNIEIESKGHADYVSEVDREAEAIARNMIVKTFPDDAIVGEEHGGIPSNSYWVIDPIDGTVNFLSGLPFWAVSIAYIENGEPLYGAIAIPAFDFKMTGGGDFQLETKGSIPKLEKCTSMAFGIGRNPVWKTSSRIAVEQKLEDEGYHIVNLGSCASSLAMVAAGRLFGYMENNIKLWDCAAGYVLCKMAGASSKIEVLDQKASTNIYAGWGK